MARIFIYDGREFPDPDPSLSVDQVDDDRLLSRTGAGGPAEMGAKSTLPGVRIAAAVPGCAIESASPTGPAPEPGRRPAEDVLRVLGFQMREEQ